MQHGHLVAKDAADPRDRLRRQRDLGHEQDCAVARLHYGTEYVEVHQRLA